MGSLNDSYSKLFGKAEQENRERAHKRFEEYWGWFLVLDRLANGDRTKWDYFCNMNVIEFLNSISFLKDKQDWENANSKR